ncbi:MAG TPA: hypothetical protein VIV63_06560 [Steroidobacteraceae bacterium]
MKNIKLAFAAIILGLTSSLAVAAPTTYTFDTLTSIKMNITEPTLSGVQRNATTPSTIYFIDQTNVSFRFVVNRCVPIFLTMMEKPGRYWLHVTVDPALSNVQLISCELELRS